MNRMWLGLAMIGLMAGPVLAQGRGRDPVKSERPKVIERTNPHDWTATITLNLRPMTRTNPKTKMPEREAFDFTSAAVVFPIVRETSMSVLQVTDRELEGRLRLNDKGVLDKPSEILAGYPAGVRLAKWAMLGWTGEEVEVQLKLPVTSYRTKFDEGAAMRLKWPDSWGAAQTALEPEYYIDLGFDGPYDMAPVKDLIQKWTGGKDPKSLPPAQLAKYFAGEVIRHVQPSGNGINNARTGEIEGISLQGAPETARTGRGTEFDMVCLLVAAYRQVGLPARCVIGLDAGASKDGRFLGKKGSSSIRAWAEFALVDPSLEDPIVWVPVDVVRMRKSSTRPPPLDRAWAYFGEHKEMDGVIPFAFQFFAPVKGVVSHGSPAFYGWMVTPAPPKEVVQTIRFEAITTPKRGGEDKDDKKKGPYGR